MRKNDLSYKIVYGIIFIYVAAMYLFPDFTAIETILFACGLVAVFTTCKVKIMIEINSILWGVFLGISGINMLFTKSISVSALEYLFVICAMLLLYLILISREKVEYNIFFKYLCAFGIVCVIGCILQYVWLDLLKVLNEIRLGDDNYAFFLDFASYKACCGFSYQTAITAYYLTLILILLLSVIFTAKINKKQKVTAIGIYVIVFVLLFFTAKRSFLAVNLLLLMFFFWYNYRKNFKQMLKKIVVITGVAACVVPVLVGTTRVGRLMIKKLVSGNLFTGRKEYNSIMLDAFMEHPMLGNGIFATREWLPVYNGHNIYLQVLCEQGLLCGLIMIMILIYNLVLNTKILFFDEYTREKKGMLLFSFGVQCVFVLWGLVGNPLYDIYPLVFYIGAVSFVVNMDMERRKKYEKNRNCNIKWL